MSNPTAPAAPIVSFDKRSVNRIGDMLFSMIQAFARLQGLGVRKNIGKYNPSEYSFGVTFFLKTEAGAPSDFARKARSLGLPSDCWGKTFVSTGGQPTAYKVVDIKLRNRKYPVICERIEDGKPYKLAVSQINTSTLS